MISFPSPPLSHLGFFSPKPVRKIVTQLTWPKGASFIAEELKCSASDLARHRFGCRIFCRLIEFHAPQVETQELVEEILQDELVEFGGFRKLFLLATSFFEQILAASCSFLGELKRNAFFG